MSNAKKVKTVKKDMQRCHKNVKMPNKKLSKSQESKKCQNAKEYQKMSCLNMSNVRK